MVASSVIFSNRYKIINSKLWCFIHRSQLNIFSDNNSKATFGTGGDLEILHLHDISLIRDVRAGVGTLLVVQINYF